MRAFPCGISASAVLCLALLAACGSETPLEPRDLMLAPEDFPGAAVSLLATSEHQSPDGVPSAQVELQGPGFRVLQTLVLFESREQALAALDGIRADLVSRGETGPGEPEASGVFKDHLGNEEAVSLIFIEGNGLARLTVTGPARDRRLEELAAIARDKISDG